MNRIRIPRYGNFTGQLTFFKAVYWSQMLALPLLKRFGVRAFDFWIRSEPKYESISGFSFGFDIETSYRFGFEAESKRFGQVYYISKTPQTFIFGTSLP